MFGRTTITLGIGPHSFFSKKCKRIAFFQRLVTLGHHNSAVTTDRQKFIIKTRMWANAQRDGRPAKYRWRPVLNAAKFGSRPLLVPCSNAANRRAQDLEDAN